MFDIKGGMKFMINYDEILKSMINEKNIDLVIKLLIDYLTQLEAS